MNKLIIALLFMLFLLGQINRIIDFLKSKVTSIRKFEYNFFRHFSHIFMAIILLTGAIWLFFGLTIENNFWIKVSVLFLGIFFLILSTITFILYFNYLFNQRIRTLIYNTEHGTLEINGEFISKNSIKQVNWHKVENKKLIMIWSDFEYVEIFMHQGARTVISSLLLNPQVLSSYFQNLPTSYYVSQFPLIKKGTS